MSNIQRIRDNTFKRRKRLFTSGIKRPKTKFLSSAADNNYGLAEPLIDVIDDEELIKKKDIFLEKLFKVDKDQLEYSTREQNRSQKWFSERKKRLTASKFGDVCRMRINTSCKVKVHNMLYKSSITSKEMTHGIENESLARTRFQDLTGMTVKLCGLFTDNEYPYLAASPGKIHYFILNCIKSIPLKRNFSFK